MARKPRIHVPGGVYHVMLRGNGGGRIFFSEGDYRHLYGLLEEGHERFGYRVHAFCCMPNHLHLVVQVGEVPLSRAMQNVTFRYTRRVNRLQGRVGHLFQGRYKAILVDRDSYLLELVRYIHLNPVRARLVEDAVDYPWSGQSAYMGKEQLSWLTTEWVLGQFGKRVGPARRRYARFVAQGVGEGRRTDFHHGGDDSRCLGDDDFLQSVLGADVRPERLPVPLERAVTVVCEEYQVDEGALSGRGQARRLAEARAVVAWLGMESCDATLREVGRVLRRDESSVSSALRRLRVRADTDATLVDRLHQLQKILCDEVASLQA